jgi:hypothetical protein
MAAAPQSSTRKDLFTENDPNSIRQGVYGSGVYSGCDVTAGTGLQVVVAAGVVYLAGVKTTIAGGSLAIDAETGNDRRDIITVNSGGTLAVVKGAPGVSASDTTFQKYTPYPPALPSGSVLLAEVYITDGATSFTSADILDKRVLLDQKVLRTSEKIIMTAGQSIDFYASNGTTLLMSLDSDGNLSIKGIVQQL